MGDTSYVFYVLTWAVLGVIFYFWDKSASTTLERRKINALGVFFVFILLIVFVALQKSDDGKLPAIIMLTIAMPIAMFISDKNTYFCEECGKRTQLLGKAVKYCPVCGSEIKKG
jgi:F0F1-type ATP synthase membrane subunit a